MVLINTVSSPTRNSAPVESWYIIRTISRSEHLAADEIRESGFEVFLPCAPSSNPSAKGQQAPLFPGYLFVRCGLTLETRLIIDRAKHVAGWIQFDNTIAVVPDEVVHELQSRLQAMNRDHTAWRSFNAGQTVYVTSKLFQGLAEIANGSVSTEGRIKIILQFMGRLVPAQIPWANLQHLEPELPHPPAPRGRRTRGHGRWIRRPSPAAAIPA
jgi:transcription antitermination factor NusG